MGRRVAHRRPLSGSSQATEPTSRGQRSSCFVASVEGGPVQYVMRIVALRINANGRRGLNIVFVGDHSLPIRIDRFFVHTDAEESVKRHVHDMAAPGISLPKRCA